MNGLAHVILATAAFVGTHFLMSHPLRATMVARMGTAAFRGIYTLVSLLTFGWMIWALRAVGPEPFLWTTPNWVWPIASIIMLLASILLVGSFAGNPALPGAPKNEADPRGVLAITRHPMLWSFALWSLAHALVWPQPSVLALTAGIALLALVGAAGQDAKKTKLQPAFWPEWMRKTAFVPFTGPAPARAMWPGWGALISGIALWLVATWAHPMLGAPAVGVWR